ncbi:hypothetical protein WME73_36620 [Sorangium sp. So ce302]|uniref:hypothetical protein n=1 Tax=Sorangium sp. So ce302 TaxID=3133297 RepID=UPI003F5E2B66
MQEGRQALRVARLQEDLPGGGGSRRRGWAHRDVGVLGEVERVEAARLYGARQLYDADTAIDDEVVMPQRMGSLTTSP